MTSQSGYCGSAIDQSVGGGVWSNGSNAQGAPDGSYATTNAGTGNLLLCQTFGMSIPSNATITGLSLVITELASNNTTKSHVTDLVITLYNTGQSPSNKASSSMWATSSSTQTYGSSSDTWGISLTPTIVNSTAFGVEIEVQAGSGSVTGDVDAIQMTVFYTLPVPPTSILSVNGSPIFVGGLPATAAI